MKQNFFFLIVAIILTSCNQSTEQNQNIITSDIKNFWEAYDKIISTKDSVLQYKYLDSLYFQRGTIGLQGIRQARNYTAQEYINVIKNYPKFLNSVRNNTLKADFYREEIKQGLNEIKKLYPETRPNKIYFTIGALRTGGTYLDSLALIGSEMAFTDTNTIASEFPETVRNGRQTYFNQNPIDDVVFLAIQEFVHTQQKPFVHNLLSYCLHEGVGDFVSYTALKIDPNLPAIDYGKKNESVREKFETEMFYINNQNKWLWGDAPNEFGIRDLGYYIGYQICENYYNHAEDKKEAIKTMIELDYENEFQIEDFIQKANFFSASLDELYQDFERRRPTVLGIKEFKNSSKNVNPNIKQITVEFSSPLNGHNTGVDFGDLGKDAFPKNTINGRFWSEDNTAWTIPVDLEPNKTYQLYITNNFRTQEDIPLKPYLIEFKTENK
ncbi:MAG: hypothetical protein MK105_18685 [Crocinitomicaceae bacterium]|nr:hypothetical protein [Crocinitomicaceae bacterium]